MRPRIIAAGGLALAGFLAAFSAARLVRPTDKERSATTYADVPAPRSAGAAGPESASAAVREQARVAPGPMVAATDNATLRATRAQTSAPQRYAVPSDPKQLAKRFFGEEARAIARKWEQEPRAEVSEKVEANILAQFSDAKALDLLRDVECRETLCRLQVDRNAAGADAKAKRQLAGKLGANGWLLDGAASDEMLAFVPIDFQPI